jgi:ATP-binding cassette subfamily B protein
MAESRSAKGAAPRSDAPVGPFRFGPPGGPFGMGAPVVKPKDTRATLLRMWRYLRTQRTALWLTVGLVMVATGLDLAGPYLMGLAIDNYIGTSDLAGLARTVWLMIVVFAFSSLVAWWQSYIAASMGQYLVRDMRRDLFKKLQSLPLRYLDTHAHGDVMSRLTNDVENVNNVISGSASMLVSSLLGLVGTLALMLYVNIPMTIVVLLTVPISYYMTKLITKHTRSGFREQQQHLGALNGIIEETVSGQRVVKAFVREETVHKSFVEANTKLRAAATRAGILSGFMGPLMNMVGNVSLAIVCAAGGGLVISGLSTVGNIASFINYSRRFTRPLNQIAQMFNSIQSALAGAERVFALLDENPEPVDAPEAQAPQRIAGDVVFENVSFGYEPGVPVLKGISLHAEPGKTVALVGPTGAGKTTIVNLLTRFYEIDGGSIRIDGEDIHALKLDTLRRKLGLVLQDNFLFGDTVMANIRYGRLDATDEDVMEAARYANADSFIRRLPDGYQTELSERGSNLSQGQRQLVAIARAILADPDILILDEATSNVDTRTEVHLQEALLRLMKGRTSFVIAHRLSTIRGADQVLVIKDGEIIERGRHQELLAQGGYYHHLYTQFKGQVIETASDAQPQQPAPQATMVGPRPPFPARA